jgi:2-polyprenyl-3-methyl-5-hydroxy-6-metoxy-1,4-benzoquinol methylase
MPLFLSQRDTESRERMDNPDCDPDELRNTYRQFGRVNAWISQWDYIYKSKIRPQLQHNAQNTLLDIGFGGGDIPIALARWATEDGFNLSITAVDPDPRAINFVAELDYPSNITFLQCGISELNPSEEQFDFVISNHLIHHLKKKELLNILEQSRALSTTSVIFNDLRRSNWAYLLFNIFSRPIFRSSFITEDGLTSIKRSYTQKELQANVPQNWKVQNLFPFRLLLTYDHK